MYNYRNSVSLGGKADMQQLLSSLPANSMPPFIQTLVSSLTNLTSQVYMEYIMCSRSVCTVYMSCR